MNPFRLSNVVAFLCVYQLCAFPIDDAVLFDGTPVRLRLARNVSSASAQEGESVDFEVLDDVVVGGRVWAKRGSVAMGTVTEAQSKRRMGRAGKLNINIDHFRLGNGDKVALRAVRESKGGSNVGKMTGAIVATSIIFFPAAPLFLLAHGKDVNLPKGTEITAYVNGEIKLSASALSVPQPSETAIAGGLPSAVSVSPSVPTRTGKAMTNRDIYMMKRAGLSEELIAEKVRTTPGNYALDSVDIVQFKDAGVGEVVIREILRANP